MDERPNRSSRAEYSSKMNIDMMPLIDVVFLLLSFFVFTMIFMVLQRGISVELVEASRGQIMPKDLPIFLTIDKDGGFYLDKEKVESKTELANQFQSLALENSQKTIVLNADGASAHSNVIQAIELCQENGMSNIVFTVEPK